MQVWTIGYHGQAPVPSLWGHICPLYTTTTPSWTLQGAWTHNYYATHISTNKTTLQGACSMSTAHCTILLHKSQAFFLSSNSESNFLLVLLRIKKNHNYFDQTCYLFASHISYEGPILLMRFLPFYCVWGVSQYKIVLLLG